MSLRGSRLELSKDEDGFSGSDKSALKRRQEPGEEASSESRPLAGVSPALLRWGPQGEWAVRSPSPSLLGLTCLPQSQPPLEAPEIQAPRLGFTSASSRQGQSEDQGSLLLCGQQRAAGLPQGHHNPPGAASSWESALFPTQTNILGANCPQHKLCHNFVLFPGLGQRQLGKVPSALWPDGQDPPLTCCVALGRPPNLSGLTCPTASMIGAQCCWCEMEMTLLCSS